MEGFSGYAVALAAGPAHREAALAGAASFSARSHPATDKTNPTRHERGEQASRLRERRDGEVST